jgi:hypothetical protein
LLEHIEPWGPKRADYHAAVICWTIAAAHYGGTGRRPQLRDFLKLFDFDGPEAQTTEDLAGLFAAIAGKK